MIWLLLALLMLPMASAEFQADYVHLGYGTSDLGGEVIGMQIVIASLILGGVMLVWMATQMKEEVEK